MKRPSKIELKSVDDRLLDGLVFCKRVYDIYDNLLALPDGAIQLRHRKGAAKKLVEELIPLATLVQEKYSGGAASKFVGSPEINYAMPVFTHRDYG